MSIARRIAQIWRSPVEERREPEAMLGYGLIKAEGGMLDPGFARTLAARFGLKSFIETGTYRGDTLAPLIETFDQLFSIELEPSLYRAAMERFKAQDKVHLLHGNSGKMLGEALEEAQGPALIWLDAHFSGEGTAYGGANTPVYDELEAIFASSRKGDVLLIDDLRCFGTPREGFTPHSSLEGYPSAADLAGRLREKGYTAFALCDSLLALPEELSITPSPVLQSCTALRLGFVERAAHEAVIRAAQGEERRALLTIPAFIEAGAPYGLGGDYYYWRALVLEQDNPEQSSQDRAFAQSCGVIA